ncbi:MAG TPA: hypothetical protein VKZ58_06145 [Longimicrobiales bacterium]|nr:hypothetical protein [Longimicrobiales bacterium]
MKRIPLPTVAALLLAVAVQGCARAHRAPEIDTGPEERLHRALLALDRRDYVAAAAELEWLQENHRASRLGHQAYLLLAAVELDPRNPDRSPDALAALAAADLATPARARWSVPISEALYLIALELGAQPPEVPGPKGSADPEQLAPAPLPLPELGRPPLVAEIAELRQERDSLVERIQRLEQDLARREAELARKEQELERIRKILRP